MGGEHIETGAAENSGTNDNVVEVSFDRPRRETAAPTPAGGETPQDEAKAIKACLRHLQEQAAAIDERMAAQLIGAAAQAIGEDAQGGSRRP
ncbi:hypothetical protein SAMN05216241_11322 [Limimonas halophila]|uniref:Uncharacterized protein n=1 Tax=Limimonas halophila TaxID=1082479 RepID=A0A1G7UAM5_9PROT|nr:hypothetical protein [Limimonas halophila]SDG44533.1 hypothetical protein SAMN05216241_11322 [Limimonas halophila]